MIWRCILLGVAAFLIDPLAKAAGSTAIRKRRARHRARDRAVAIRGVSRR